MQVGIMYDIPLLVVAISDAQLKMFTVVKSNYVILLPICCYVLFIVGDMYAIFYWYCSLCCSWLVEIFEK